MTDVRPCPPPLPRPTPASAATFPPPSPLAAILPDPPAPPSPPPPAPVASVSPATSPAAASPVAPPAPPVAAPTLPPSAPAAAPTAPGRLPHSTIDALRGATDVDHLRFRGQRRRPWLVQFFFSRFAVLLVVLAIGGVIGALEKFDIVSLKPVDATHPEQWDPRVESVAAFVETERGLTFDHPVDIDFLSEQEFVELFSDEVGELDPATVEYYDDLSSLYDAAGLAVDFDLLAGQSTVSAVSTLGLYSPVADRIFIRGNELTPDVRAVLAHELVHALQAQHFDLTLGGPDDLALRSIVEADALRVEEVFIATFSDADQEAARAGLTAGPDDEAALSDVPVVLVERRQAPYILGPLLVDTAFAERGNVGVDTLLATPPSEEILVDPTLFGTGQHEAAITVTVPKGATIIEEPHPLSMIDMLSMLDAWLPWTQARGALDGWNGGGYASYTSIDGSACFAVDAAFDTAPEDFAVAVAAWSSASGSSATPAIDGKHVRFEACERGATATAPPQPVISMTSAIFFEHSAITSLPDNVTPTEVAGWRCVARSLIDHPEAAPLLMKSEWTPEDQGTYDWIVGTIYPICGVQPTAG